METESSSAKETADDRFKRWQKEALDQLGYALNLVLTLTVAALGYCFALLKDKDFILGASAKCPMIASLTALSVSAVCGLVCVIVRLWNVRGTARRARQHPDAPTKEALDRLGHVTWGLFYAQSITFAVGVAALGTTLLLTYGGKLR